MRGKEFESDLLFGERCGCDYVRYSVLGDDSVCGDESFSVTLLLVETPHQNVSGSNYFEQVKAAKMFPVVSIN